MNYKKIISVFLSVLLCVMCIDTHIIYSDISNESETVYISTIINGTAKRLPAIQNEEGILFVSGEILSDITVYNNRNLKPTIFEHDNATEINKYREILIEKDNKQAHVIAFWNNQRIIKKQFHCLMLLIIMMNYIFQ